AKGRRVILDRSRPALLEAIFPPARERIARPAEAPAQPLLGIEPVEIRPVRAVVVAEGKGRLGPDVTHPLEWRVGAQDAPVAIRLPGVVPRLQGALHRAQQPQGLV